MVLVVLGQCYRVYIIATVTDAMVLVVQFRYVPNSVIPH